MVDSILGGLLTSRWTASDITDGKENINFSQTVGLSASYRLDMCPYSYFLTIQ